MARKRQRYQSRSAGDDNDEQVEPPDRDEELFESRALAKLALRLAGMTADQRQQLPLDDLLQEEIAVLARLGRKTAHRRQLLRVQGLLRAADVHELRARLAGSVQEDARHRALERVRGKLIDGGDAELEVYLAAHPAADRQQLRSLIRQARKEGPAAKKAARRLFQLLKAVPPIGVE